MFNKIIGNMRFKRAVSLFLLMAMIIPFISGVQSVEANSGDGQGHRPTEPGLGVIHHATGGDPVRGQDTTAWNYFKHLQSEKYANNADFEKAINNLPNSNGFLNPDGSRESLLESCKRSQHIWWYGSNREWVGKTGIPYKSGTWYTEANRTDEAYWVNDMDSSAKDSWDRYLKTPSSNWGKSSGPVLVCSGAYTDPEVIKIPVVIKAKNGLFEYDGRRKTVQGWDSDDLGKLLPNHEFNAYSIRTETEIGIYDVTFAYADIVEKDSRKSVAHMYDITEQDGKLQIFGDIPIDEPEQGLEDSELWRCIDHQSDSATAYVNNAVSGAHGYSPQDYLPGDYKDRDTHAGIHADGGRTLPGVGAGISQWNSWKQSFLSQNPDKETPELDLEHMGVSRSLSKFGGVYNITRTLQLDTYDVVHCQPQTRFWDSSTTCSTDDEGNRSCSTSHFLSPWEDSGERILDSSSGPSTEREINSYQLLSVNCNKSGFDSIKSSVGGEDISLAQGHGGAALKTPEQEGANSGSLGKSGPTSTIGFYEDGTSCRDAYKCTSDKLPGAEHDGDNNRGNAPLFTEERDDGVHGEPTDNNLVFFRDNEDRQVRADVWYPKETGLQDLISKPKDKAQRTFAKVYGGTPEWDITTIAPWGGGSEIGSIAPGNRFATDADWANDKNRFNMKSQWASEDGSPYELGINWRYEGTGLNITPAKVDGYKVLGMTSPYTYNFNVYCEFQNTPGNSQQANIPKSPIKNGITREIWSGTDSIKTLFTRSVTDTHK